MNRILLHFPDFLYGRIFDPEMRDSYADPYIYLKERLHALGYELVTSDDYPVEGCNWLFFFDAPSVLDLRGLRGRIRNMRRRLHGRRPIRDLYGEAQECGLGDKCVLFLLEPPSVNPNNWQQKLHKMFRVIFTWNDVLVDGEKFHKIRWPQARRFPHITPVPFQDKKLLVNISMNKHSRHQHALYSARSQSIRYFDRKQPAHFDLYGVGWDRPTRWQEWILPFMQPKYSCYRGTVKNKWDVLPYYRFALCYENIDNQAGYITEKIFDCMRADCVPIYWGAPNVTEYVHADAFIDRRRFESDAELEQYLLSVTESRYESYRQAIATYLASERFKGFLPFAFADTIVNVLRLG